MSIHDQAAEIIEAAERVERGAKRLQWFLLSLAAISIILAFVALFDSVMNGASTAGFLGWLSGSGVCSLLLKWAAYIQKNFIAY